MSFFYLSPVKGDVQVHLLEFIVDKRLEYLRTHFRGESTSYSEFLVEGSLYDNIGHFTLCILSILSKDADFKEFLLRAEIGLFKRRLECLSSYELRSFAKKILLKIHKELSVPPFIKALKVICRHLLIKALSHHICSPVHSNVCSKHNIPLNFKHCLLLISKRQVELKNGTVYLPCSKWKQYLQYLFRVNLQYRINNTNVKPLETDPRIQGLLLKIKRGLPPEINSNCKVVLLSKNVDNITQFFPPCMLNLHRNLRVKHRLSHTQRFYYSLFLKDIGMPVEEATKFWKTEYIQAPNGSHPCCHNWVKDEKRFLYGIRHLYGLEGGRKEYSSVGCRQIQSAEGSCTEGGCPFKSFDYTNMLQVLSIMCPDSLSQINELRKSSQYTSACMLFLKKKHKTSIECDNHSFNFTPVKYYMASSKDVEINL